MILAIIRFLQRGNNASNWFYCDGADLNILEVGKTTYDFLPFVN